MSKMDFQKEIALLAVLKEKRDLKILLKEGWYRIPKESLPKREFNYIIFYQPESFGRQGQRISYYAKVTSSEFLKREELLPNEQKHPRAKNFYLKINLNPVIKLKQSIKNFPPRRISFALVTLASLFTAKNILELYKVPATEEIIRRALKKEGIEPVWQHHVIGEKRYCLDLAIPCMKGQVAIECDNKKAHAGKTQKIHDQNKDRYLRRHGWQVVRLGEKEIIFNLHSCLQKIHSAIKAAGGTEPHSS